MKLNHVPRFAAPIVSILAPVAFFQPAMLHASLNTYDAAIAADHGEGDGPFPYAAVLTEAASVDGSDSVDFNFGDITGDATFEFILEGDPVDGGRDGYLAVGENSGNNLRYEQWDDTGQLGFTRLGVADNLFLPEDDEDLLLSPEEPTHIAYVWMEDDGRMELYVDGTLGGAVDGVDFEMPFGEGLLGNNSAGSEGMLGTIHRVTTYDSALSAATIMAHAEAWLASDTDPRLVDRTLGSR